MIALALICFIGIRNSRLTQLSQVTIESNSESDVARLQSIVKQYENVPAMQIPEDKIEIAIRKNLQVKEVEFSANVFGRGNLKVSYRKPVARLASAPRFCIDGEGYLFPYRGLMPNLVITANMQQMRPILCLSDQSELSDLSQLASKLQVQQPKLAGNLDLDASGRLFFQVTGSARIVFGRGDRLEDKIAVLSKLIAADSGILENAKEINLVEPQEPAMTPKVNGTNK